MTTHELETMQQDDPGGPRYTIYHSTRFAFSPAYPHFLKGKAEMIESGHGWGWTDWKDEGLEVIYVRDNTEHSKGQVIASSVFRPNEELSYFWIEMTTVSKEYRGQGLYQFMHKHYEKLAKVRGIRKISATVQIDNIATIKARTSVGFKTTMLTMDKIIK